MCAGTDVEIGEGHAESRRRINLVGMRGPQPAGLSPLVGQVAFHLDTLLLVQYLVEHEEFRHLALGVLKAVPIAAELNALGLVRTVARTRAVGGDLGPVEPCVAPVGGIHGGGVEVPGDVGSATCLGQPTVEVGDAFLVTGMKAEQPVPVVVARYDALVVAARPAGDRENGEVGHLAVQALDRPETVVTVEIDHAAAVLETVGRVAPLAREVVPVARLVDPDVDRIARGEIVGKPVGVDVVPVHPHFQIVGGIELGWVSVHDCGA